MSINTVQKVKYLAGYLNVDADDIESRSDLLKDLFQVGSEYYLVIDVEVGETKLAVIPQVEEDFA